jgi:hypothetical protein
MNSSDPDAGVRGSKLGLRRDDLAALGSWRLFSVCSRICDRIKGDLSRHILANLKGGFLNGGRYKSF